MERLLKIIATPDGCFLVAGGTTSPAGGGKTSPLLDTDRAHADVDAVGDLWVVKLSQSGVKLWDGSFGGVGRDDLVDLVSVPDGGVMVGGTGFNGIAVPIDNGPGDWAFLMGSRDFLVARTDATGKTLWQQYLGGVSDDALAGLILDGDSRIIAAGSSRSGPSGNKTEPLLGGSDAWLVGLNLLGQIVSEQTIGGTLPEVVSFAKRTRDGGMILVGDFESGLDSNGSMSGFGGVDMWVVRLDASGTKMWELKLGGSGFESATAGFEMPDGGFLVGGVSTSPASGNKTSPLLNPDSAEADPDVWIVKFDAQGRIQWDRSVGTTLTDIPIDLTSTPDGGVLALTQSFAWFVTPTDSGGLLLTKISSTGEELWHLGFTNLDFARVLGLEDGGALVGLPVNYTSPNFPQPGVDFHRFDCMLVRLDAHGNRVWEMTLGGGGGDAIATLDRTQDGGFIVGIDSEAVPTGDNGNKTHRGYGQSDFWVVKLGSEVPPDSDGDGVSDDVDHCPNTPAGQVVSATGCSIDQLVPCDSPWRNHGDYVNRVARMCTQFREAGLISQEESSQTLLRAVKSNCGGATKTP